MRTRVVFNTYEWKALQFAEHIEVPNVRNVLIFKSKAYRHCSLILSFCTNNHSLSSLSTTVITYIKKKFVELKAPLDKMVYIARNKLKP